MPNKKAIKSDATELIQSELSAFLKNTEPAGIKAMAESSEHKTAELRGASGNSYQIHITCRAEGSNTVRVAAAAYLVRDVPWWHFWDSAVVTRSELVNVKD
jgi:hypothetical protein